MKKTYVCIGPLVTEGTAAKAQGTTAFAEPRNILRACIDKSSSISINHLHNDLSVQASLTC